MLRRNVLKNIFSVLAIALVSPLKAFSRIFQEIEFTAFGKINLSAPSMNAPRDIVRYKSRNTDYVSVAEFARAIHLSIYTNKERRKTVLYLDKDRITFTAENAFALFNDHVIQMEYRCGWFNGQVLVPLQELIRILTRFTALNLRFDSNKGSIDLERPDVNITGVRIAPKDNGTMIHVYSQKKFDEKEISLDIRNGWFHIDVYGGKIDTAGIAKIPGAGIIRKVQGFQLGETASIAFQLRGKILSRELVQSSSGNDFYVNLRTKELLKETDTDETVRKDLEKQKDKWRIDTIVLDAGHGGKDPGAIGYGKLYEKTIVLPIVLKLGKIIEKDFPGVKVVYTRKSDVFIPLWKRTKIANEVDGKLFISVHCNSSTSRRANGFETYFLSADKDARAKEVVLKENAVIDFEESHDRERYEGVNFILATMAQSAFIKQSQLLASKVQTSLNAKLGRLGMTSRGVKQGPFWVMVGATMPNILVETGYISNKHESRLLKKSTTQKKIAEAIFEGIKQFKNEMERGG